MHPIGAQDGIEAACNRLRDLDPAGTLLKKTASGWPDITTLTKPVDQWKAYDKFQRTLQILKQDHDAINPSPPPTGGLSDAQARIFLAGNPLDAMQAPPWMVPVITADFGNYRSDEEPKTYEEILQYLDGVVETFKSRFTLVETWADCRNPTYFSDADRLARDLQLDGVWGQCEDAGEFDNALQDGALRMVGQLSGLREDQKKLISQDGVHITFELYRNKMPWQVPDYSTCGSGVGGNCIGVYESDTEGAVYTPVSDYKSLGYYVPHRDSVYGVGLKPQDWVDLA